MKRACVFCASSQQVPRYFFDDARVLAQQLVQNDFAVQYGGGAMGLMGAVADEVLSLQGAITGIIPRFMIEVNGNTKAFEI